MACYRPLDCWQRDDGSITFKERGGDLKRALRVPCGRCIGCRLDRAQSWAVRCMHEAHVHGWCNSFVTLTYKPEECPSSLRYEDFRGFMKRLRKVKGPTRFFMCGEYGEQLSRPHYHALLFGCWFHDRYPWKENLYRSGELEALWPLGFSSVGDVTFDSAGYVARYVTEKVVGDGAEAHYRRVDPATGECVDLEPEFCRMSLKPGIGAPWLARYHRDVFGGDTDSVVVGGRHISTPRYYLKKLREWDSDDAERVELARSKFVRDYGELSESRLAAREAVARARLFQRRKKEL